MVWTKAAAEIVYNGENVKVNVSTSKGRKGCESAAYEKERKVTPAQI